MVGGFVLILLSLFLIQYSLNLLWVTFIVGGVLLLYYEITLSPEEKERRRLSRERKEAERRHLEFVRKEARARAEGEAYGAKIGYENAKNDISWKRRSTLGFGSSPLMDSMFGRPATRRRKRR